MIKRILQRTGVEKNKLFVYLIKYIFIYYIIFFVDIESIGCSVKKMLVLSPLLMINVVVGLDCS